MRKQAVNPYLPGWEYIPDGEPHVFNDRLYVYGSHDLENGDRYCLDDYTVWSTPLDDLSAWRRDTDVSYARQQDPFNENGAQALAAPDVVRGPDGRYYIYYVIGFNPIGVAVSDRPEGPFTYYGSVRDQEGNPLHDGVSFDPAVLCEGGKVWLYYGFAPPFHHPSMGESVNKGAYAVQLDKDMLTAVTEPVCVASGWETKDGTSFSDHPFFEASSIRHFGRYYYFIYSSLQGHELCYAMGTSPEGPFTFKGVLVSNADIGYKGNETPVNDYANNHGSIVQIADEYYIFYHRHTHGTHFSRQGCAEKLHMKEDGTFEQVCMSSCGLNGGPLEPGRYSAHIICNLLNAEGAEKIPSGKVTRLNRAVITEETRMDGVRNSYVAHLSGGCACAVKYIRFEEGEYTAEVTVRGDKGTVHICLDDISSPTLSIECAACEDWQTYTGTVSVKGTHTVWFVFETIGELNFDNFAFLK